MVFPEHLSILYFNIAQSYGSANFKKQKFDNLFSSVSPGYFPQPHFPVLFPKQYLSISMFSKPHKIVTFPDNISTRLRLFHFKVPINNSRATFLHLPRQHLNIHFVHSNFANDHFPTTFHVFWGRHSMRFPRRGVGGGKGEGTPRK